MDIGRAILMNNLPKHRLDAGTVNHYFYVIKRCHITLNLDVKLVLRKTNLLV